MSVTGSVYNVFVSKVLFLPLQLINYATTCDLTSLTPVRPNCFHTTDKVVRWMYFHHFHAKSVRV